MTVLIIHGIGGHAGIHWQKWLRDQLTASGIKVLMPDMPTPERPNRQEWLRAVQELLAKVDDQIIIIGHSLGVTTALDYLEDAPQPIKALVSVSGFGRDYGVELNHYFLAEKDIDWKKVKGNINKSFVLYGDNDPYVPQEALAEVAFDLGVEPQIFPGGGHLNSEAGYLEFPALLKVVSEQANL